MLVTIRCKVLIMPLRMHFLADNVLCGKRTVSFVYYSEAVVRLFCHVTSRSNSECRYIGLALILSTHVVSSAVSCGSRGDPLVRASRMLSVCIHQGIIVFSSILVLSLVHNFTSS